MPRAADFYQTHLDRVSRSFAFCIEQLESPLREWVGLSYLLCRVVDTIEDATWANAGAQSAAFAVFDRALDGDVRAADSLAQLIPASVPAHEMDLLTDAARLFVDFADLDPRARLVIAPAVRCMSGGMQNFARVKPLRLGTLPEVNRYCFFVAGVVGELLAGLLNVVEPDFTVNRATLANAHHFGQFLQKVNVLKDQVDDERVGRFLVPARDLVEADAARNACRALDFLLSVPRARVDFRRFCAWSLFIGLETLRVTKDSVRLDEVVKVPRERTIELLGTIETRLGEDGELRSLFDDLARAIAPPQPRPRTDRVEDSGDGRPPAWFLDLYEGPLTRGELADLGV